MSPKKSKFKKLSLPKELKCVKFVSSESQTSIDTFGNFVIFIGKNIPKKNNSDLQTSISKQDLDEFMQRQPYFDGMTRLPAIGMWHREMEDSEAVYVFGTTLKDVLCFSYHYCQKFDQEAVFVQLLNTPTLLLFNPELEDKTND